MSIRTETIMGLEWRINKAEERYGAFRSSHEGLGVALEEWTELGEAIRSNDPAQIEAEALDLAAVLIRLAEGIHFDEALRARSTK